MRYKSAVFESLECFLLLLYLSMLVNINLRNWKSVCSRSEGLLHAEASEGGALSALRGLTSRQRVTGGETWLVDVTPHHFDLVYTFTLNGTSLRPCDHYQSVKPPWGVSACLNRSIHPPWCLSDIEPQTLPNCTASRPHPPTVVQTFNIVSQLRDLTYSVQILYNSATIWISWNDKK